MSAMQQMLLGSGGSTASFRYARIYITANVSGTSLAIQEVEFRLTPGGADVTTPATPVTVSSFYPGYPGSKMVDNSVSNDQDVWDVESVTFPQHAIFDLGAGFDFLTVQQVAIMPQNNGALGPNRAPKDFTIDYGPSDTGPWTNAKTVTNSTGWTAGVFRTFSIP